MIVRAMKTSWTVGVLVAALAACGDNSNECDPGTTRNENGVCVGTLTCSEGTVLVDGKCEIDPNACQDGTVLVGGACVDPGHVTADVEEGAEPNGLGIIELSADPAGEITLKPAGEHFVIHGTIVPFQDDDDDGQLDPDIDTYFVEVTAPTMLTVSADGLHGLAGGFLSVANVASTHPMSDWQRFGVNLTGDTSKRQLYLPVPGVYLIAIGDSRSLLLAGGAAGAAEGAPAFEYYVTIDQNPVTPEVLTVTDGVATSTGTRQPGEVKLYSVTLGEGINDAELVTNVPQVVSSVLITNTRAGATKLIGLGDAADPDPAAASGLGIRTGDSSLVVSDSLIDYTLAPYDYELTVTTRGAGALSTNGGDAVQPGSDLDFSTFYYDVAPDGLTVGMDLAFDVPVSGVIVDEDFFIFSNFAFDPFFGFSSTFDTYTGLLRHAKPGRYYFLTFDPDFDPDAPTDITATSTYNAVTIVPIVKGTALANQAVNAFASNPFTYAPGTAMDPWQQFTGSGTGTGTIVAAFYDPDDAIGRLDPLTFVDDQCFICDDQPFPLFDQTYAEGGTTNGRILLDNAALTTFFVQVKTATTTGSPTFSLDFAPRPGVTDLGNLAAGMTATSTNNTLDGTTTIHRFLIRTTASNTLDVTSTPATGLDTRIQRVNVDETAAGAAVDNGGDGAADTTSIIQGASGFTAFTIDAAAGTGTFDLSVDAIPPPYTTATGTTAFADACAGGTAVTFDDNDEGQSGVINAPANFDYFGSPVTQLKMFSNGFLTFDTAVACASVGGSCFFGNADMPSANAPNAIVAPYWDDVVTTACQKTMGTKLILQWGGTFFGSSTQVSFQVILDGSNDTIEFVYGPTHAGTGSSATIGIENQAGTQAIKLSFNQTNMAPKTLFTPQ